MLRTEPTEGMHMATTVAINGFGGPGRADGPEAPGTKPLAGRSVAEQARKRTGRGKES
jgi:hypothetical protein